MNTKQQNILRSLLKKYKFKSVSNMVRQALGINFENFLQKTEPLYIIPRIASCYAVEGDKEKLMGIVYKEWLKDVVEKAWVKPLNAYIDEYGERIVLSAIYYLIDNGLWEVYEGRLALDAQEDNYYDKLGDMPSAIEFVQEQQAEEKKAEEKKAAEEAAAKKEAAQQQASASSRPPSRPRSQRFHRWQKGSNPRLCSHRRRSRNHYRYHFRNLHPVKAEHRAPV